MKPRLTSRERDAAESHIRKFLKILGVDIETDDLADTPARYTRAMEELTSGIVVDAAKLPFTFTTFAKSGNAAYDQLITVRAISFASMCSHHLLPFFGKVWVGYLPGERAAGYSKIIRLVNYCAARPQMQEEMTENIAEMMVSILNPKAVIVVVRGTHTCSRIRGVKDCTAEMVTSAIRGADAQSIKQEFLELCRLGDSKE